MPKVTVKEDEVRVGKRLSVSFQRTLRIPDDGKVYPLPPTLGRFPLSRAEDYTGSVPVEWKKRGDIFLPMYQREALWLAFDAPEWHPSAVQVATGGVNAVSGEHWEARLSADPQNYLVVPEQMWLDGINAGDGVIRQFVAMPLGLGYTIEAQLTGKEEFGGIQICGYDPKPGRFPDRPPPRRAPGFIHPMGRPMAALSPGGMMGLGAGGRMEQKLYPDKYGLDTWDEGNSGKVFIHIVNSEQYRDLTGRMPPRSPVNAKTYTEHGFPWFELYDEGRGSLPASRKLSRAKSVREVDVSRGGPDISEEDRVEINPKQVKKIKRVKSSE
jgi:hypothetical protein